MTLDSFIRDDEFIYNMVETRLYGFPVHIAEKFLGGRKCYVMNPDQYQYYGMGIYKKRGVKDADKGRV